MKIRSTDCVNAILHFFYPSYCLHCDGPLVKKNHLLCHTCFELIEWIRPSNRCIYCAGPSPCVPCKGSPCPLRPHLSLFEGCGPILSLYYHFLRTKQGDGLASFLLLAFSRSSFSIPDVIVPNTTRLFPKKEPSYLLANHLARFLKRSCLLPGPSLKDKSVLLITPTLHDSGELLDMKRYLNSFFPIKILSFALIDYRF